MILFAAIVPDPAVLHAVEEAVGDEAGLLRPAEQVNLPIARFGNTTGPDADRLIAELKEAAHEWSPMRLSLGGASVSETPAERTLGTEVRGDVEALARLSLDIKQAAQAMRFLLDRRDFSPVVTLASVRAGRPSGLDAAAAALASFESESWLVTDMSMRKQTYGSDGASEEVAWIPLAGG